MQKQTKKKLMLCVLFCFICSQVLLLNSCISPNAVKTEVQGIKNDMSKMEELIDQKADVDIVAETVEDITCDIDNVAQIAEEVSVELEDISLWRKNVQAETINYGGAEWVVIGASIIVLIFVIAGVFLVKAFMKRGTMLCLLTSAIKSASYRNPSAVNIFKEHLKEETKIGKFSDKDIELLKHFTKKNNTFTKQNMHNNV